MVWRIVLAVVAVIVAWWVLDFVIHGLILADTYEATSRFWRAPEQMKQGVMFVTIAIAAIAFVLVYALFVGRKRWATGVLYGLIFGVGNGVSMGYATYAVMPIPYSMALTWFLGAVVEAVIAGLLVGLIVRGPRPEVGEG